MYDLVNIPHKNDKVEIAARIDGQQITIVQCREGRDYEIRLGSMYVGDHMFGKPDDLRKMIGDAIVAAIYRARDVGYRQAQQDIRDALGVARS